MLGLRRTVLIGAVLVLPLVASCSVERPEDNAWVEDTTIHGADRSAPEPARHTVSADESAETAAAVPPPSAEEATGEATDEATETETQTEAPAPSQDPAAACVSTVLDGLSAQQRAGQLVMAAVHTGTPAEAMRPYIAEQHVGNVLYLGGWEVGRQEIAAISAGLQDQAPEVDEGPVGLLVAADQEGGVVQQLKGPGFSSMPSAMEQSSWPRAELVRAAAGWGTELKDAGVNLNLAPVQDVVPPELGRGNGPIGQWDRQYGNDAREISQASVAFIEGMQEAGVGTSIKHFPGIGRLQGNPDHTTDGLVDDQLTADDPYLEPFRAGIRAGASTVMVGSATYPHLDDEHPAMFSSKIVDGLLRDELGYDGVVISDDINAAAVRDRDAGARATGFIAAGGDIVLTGDTASSPQLVAAIVEEGERDDAFAKKVDASVQRVLTLKESMGLLPCED